MRLRTLPLALSVGILSLSLVNHTWESKIVLAALLLITIILLQVLSNLANDYGDFQNGADNENRTGPLRQVQSGNISMRSMRIAILINALLALVTGTSLLLVSGISWVHILFFLILGLSAIWAAIRYTAGRNPYGYRGLGDLAVFLFFGPVGIMGSVFVLSSDFIVESIPASLLTGCGAVMVLNLNNLRDESSDRESGKVTLVVKYGNRFGRRYHFILFFIVFICSVLVVFPPNLLRSLINGVFMWFVFINQRSVWADKDFHRFDSKMKPLALSLFSFTLLQWLLHIFTH